MGIANEKKVAPDTDLGEKMEDTKTMVDYHGKTHCLYVLLILSFAFIFYSCASKEKKAEKLVNEWMLNNLDDISSYEPIKTTVDTVYNDIFHDDSALVCAAKNLILREKAQQYLSELEAKQAMLEIWSIDPYSSYSKRKIKSLLLEGGEINEKMLSSELAALKELLKIKSINDTLKPDELKEWEIKHTFRVKNPEGVSKLFTFYFRMNKDCKKIDLLYSDDSMELHDNMIDCIQESIDMERQNIEKLIEQLQESIDSNKSSLATIEQK